MTFSVIAEAEARREWNEAVDWYEERETGAGWRFDDELQAGMIGMQLTNQ